jgi:hypothetical protein
LPRKRAQGAKNLGVPSETQNKMATFGRMQ